MPEWARVFSRKYHGVETWMPQLQGVPQGKRSPSHGNKEGSMSVAPQPETRRVVLIDLSAVFHPCGRASENEPVSTAIQATLDAVRKCTSKDPNALVAI